MNPDPQNSEPRPPGRPDSPAAKPSAVLPAAAMSLLVVAAMAGGAVATRDAWLPLLRGGPQIQAADPSPQIAALEARVKALEDRPPVSTPTVSPALPPVSAPALDKAQWDDLARRLAESESRAADLAQRLAAVEGARTQHARTDAAAQALILAVGQVRAQASAGRPFPKELESLKALAAARPDIAGAVETISPIAASGAPTAADLRRTFEIVARAVAIAARSGDKAAQDADWVARMKARLFALVAIRRTDGAADGTPDALILAAETALAAGDIAQAAAALEKLSGPAAAPTREWLAAARARVALDAALAELHARAVAVLAGGG